MKTLVHSSPKTLLLGIALLVSTLSMAQRVPTASYYEDKTFDMAVFPATAPSKMWIHVEKDARRPLRIDLTDDKGHVLASEWYSQKRSVVRTRFDLGALGDGIYTFRITDGRQTQERTFKLATPGFTEQLPQRLITMN